VKNSPPQLAEMLRHSKGKREVPVIVEDGRVTIGYGGT
jgi:glutaredoxin 3